MLTHKYKGTGSVDKQDVYKYLTFKTSMFRYPRLGVPEPSVDKGTLIVRTPPPPHTHTHTHTHTRARTIMFNIRPYRILDITYCNKTESDCSILKIDSIF